MSETVVCDVQEAVVVTFVACVTLFFLVFFVCSSGWRKKGISKSTALMFSPKSKLRGKVLSERFLFDSKWDGKGQGLPGADVE